jgi:hypothetical protein
MVSVNRNNIPIRDSVIYTVCVNSVAYKFITTVVNLEEEHMIACNRPRDGGINSGICFNAA